ncbi:hypothetical protein BDQ12DRAFT_678435 [Crucibulum laeve]|uniref:Uncharacterized protein n=1 Tax=Crucibulum laeve TaxID=68775 RepID=A0A5C3M911_9AGAR|nr:hypothetical protein BDQ12DRAFT_678435 [Crucibulum laeve]
MPLAREPLRRYPMSPSTTYASSSKHTTRPRPLIPSLLMISTHPTFFHPDPLICTIILLLPWITSTFVQLFPRNKVGSDGRRKRLL